MQINFDENATGLTVVAYDKGWIKIGASRITAPCVVTPTAIHGDLLPAELASLQLSHILRIADLAPEVILLGTGADQVFVDSALSQHLMERAIGLEVMDTGAACRSYNILAVEGRAVAAALFMI